MQWVTRARPKVDRIACPWLIRRFVDPEAEFLYVPADEVIAVAERTGAIPYDVPGVELGHHGSECSFDAILKKYLLRTAALLQLARIVRGGGTPPTRISPRNPGGWKRLPMGSGTSSTTTTSNWPLSQLSTTPCTPSVRQMRATSSRSAPPPRGQPARFRRCWTALARSLRMGTVMSQPMQASVMLWP